MKRACCVLATVLSLVLGVACAEPGAEGDDDAVTPDGGGKADDPTPDGSVDPTAQLVEAIDISHWTKTISDPDVDCFWANDIRHIITGTQILDVTRAQLDVALRGGMTVDVYVYLYWAEDIEAQIAEAVELAGEYPIGRIWIDVEEAPGGLGIGELHAKIDQAIAACGDVPYGIYTGKGWWQTYYGDRHDYTDVPLWYARYDNSPDLTEWDDPAEKESFGGWTAPVGKQYDDHNPGLCGLAVDDNVMWVSATPEVEVDRTVPADDGTPPDAPTALLPDHGRAVKTVYVKPTAPPVREATGYQLELQYYGNGAWRPYWTPTRPTADLLVYPTVKNAAYRWRMRGQNAHGYGAWSSWAWFAFGSPTSLPSAAQIQL